MGKYLQKPLRFVKQMGHQVKLEVDSNNKIAKHLYETFGFQKFSGYDIYMIRDVRNMRLKK